MALTDKPLDQITADDLQALVALWDAEVQYLHAETEERAARIAADLIQTQVQLFGMLYRRQNA